MKHLCLSYEAIKNFLKPVGPGDIWVRGSRGYEELTQTGYYHVKNHFLKKNILFGYIWGGGEAGIIQI